MRALLFPLALSALVGCADPNLEAITSPPPGKQAELVDSSDARTIKLSEGVALGFDCKYENAPCAGASAEVGDPAIARVFPSYVDELSSYLCDREGSGNCSKPGVVFVVLGGKPGETTLTVTTDDGDIEMSVKIVP